MNEKILVVDDEPYIRKILKYTLDKSGYMVEECEDVYEAEELLKSKNYDLILTDLMMPIKSGLDLVRFVRSELKLDKQKIIILSAKGMENDIKLAKELEVSYYIMKPFEVGRIIKKIRMVLDGEI
ncbi:response regulator [Haliovirga abyssi]|uniref:Response regulatory domain-containing protein n=1 Tax=Haliovirga abyssi TaxID=2996794 RepID=A0AAU9DT40_9FUSO|nr:response regulator [Haliovirga abyssi]BDU50274.1 hypothetical protein HLVA_08430 [Haliovirga abyssi]